MTPEKRAMEEEKERRQLQKNIRYAIMYGASKETLKKLYKQARNLGEKPCQSK